jgi:hypothetical protein
MTDYSPGTDNAEGLSTRMGFIGSAGLMANMPPSFNYIGARLHHPRAVSILSIHHSGVAA